MQLEHYAEYHLSLSAEPIDLVILLAKQGLSDNYVIYESEHEWSIGIGKHVEISASKQGVKLSSEGKSTNFINKHLCMAVEEATRNISISDWRAYGLSKFELSHIIYGLEIDGKNEELINLFVPCLEVRVNKSSRQALLRSIDAKKLDMLISLVETLAGECKQQNNLSDTLNIHSDIRCHEDIRYKKSVASAINEIKAKQYQKVILSRRIPLPDNVDLAESFRLGRLKNDPARSFLLKNGNIGIAGFSPETVVEVSDKGLVSTQPLAGTRAMGGNEQEERILREDLLSDTKEIAEHAASVKLAQEELENICDSSSIVVSEFMAVRRRGSVQHLASRVRGQLAQGKNTWHAFEALFPAVTASGIPKKEAIEAIYRHEPDQRKWYSGSVMILDSSGAMDASLVLRSIYQEGTKSWLQAGAGIIDQSTPERELEETIEKLSCISENLMSKMLIQESVLGDAKCL